MCISGRRRNNGGFTLIELLVVIAIIAILAAILFPVLVNVRRAAYRTSCITQMRQIYAAISNYSEDNAGRFPPLLSTYDGWDTGMDIWPIMVEPYYKKKTGANNYATQNVNTWKVARCPEARQDPDELYTGNIVPNQRFNFAMTISCGLNWVPLSPIQDFSRTSPGTPPAFQPQMFSKPMTPSKTIMLVDSKRSDSREFAYGHYYVNPPPGFDQLKPNFAEDLGFDCFWWGDWETDTGLPEDPVSNGHCAFRHMESTNVIWVDGHASSLTLDTLRNPELWDLH